LTGLGTPPILIFWDREAACRFAGPPDIGHGDSMDRIAVAVLLTLSLGTTLSAQTTERTLFVTVVDDHGRPVPDLPADAFTVREDGRAREVLRASRATDPIDLALLVDNSQAVTREVMDLRKGLTAFVKTLGSQHNVALVGLADRPTILTDYTTSRAALERGIDRVFAQPGSGTTLLDAIIETSRGLQKRESARRAIVVVTTEGTDFSNRDYRQALEALRESGAALYPLVITRRGGANIANEAARNRGIVLDEGSRTTGGRLEFLLSSMSLAAELEELARELDSQYRVVYGRPGALVPPKDIEVSVSRPGLKARGTPAATPPAPRTGN